MQETASSVTAKVPPKPQHSSGRSRSTSSMPRSCPMSCRVLSKGASMRSLERDSRSSRIPWQLRWSPTLLAELPVHPGHLHHVDQVLGEVEGPLAEPAHLGRVAEQVRVVELHHGDAAGRRRHHRLVALEELHEPLGERPGLLRAAGVVHGLPAAGLVPRVLDLEAEPPQDPQRRQPHPGEELVDVAGDEEPDLAHCASPTRGIIHWKKLCWRKTSTPTRQASTRLCQKT